MPEVPAVESDLEFRQFDDLNKKSDDELEELVIRGDNLHIHSSKASVAKRILQYRDRQKQLKAVEQAEQVTKQLKRSQEELANILASVNNIRKLLKQPWWIKVSAFIVFTVFIGIIINLASTWIATFILHW